jgi:hypothetical protein
MSDARLRAGTTPPFVSRWLVGALLLVLVDRAAESGSTPPRGSRWLLLGLLEDLTALF